MFTSVKRKKRRTRKCLDELRTRSRRNITENPREQVHTMKNPLLTTERLTLQSVFPKAIRSETITRPILAELKHNQLTSFRDMKRSVKTLCNNNSPCDSKPINRKKSISANFRETPILIMGNNSNCQEVNARSDSLKIKSCNSPMDADFPYTEQMVEDSLSCTITYKSCSPSSQTPCFNMHSVYDEFMMQIPSYLTQVSSSLLQHDPIQNTVNNLQKLYLKSCQQYKENTIFKHINGKTVQNKQHKEIKEAIVKNPMEYIKLGQQRCHVGSATVLDDGSECGSTASKGSANGSLVGPGSESDSTVRLDSDCTSPANSDSGPCSTARLDLVHDPNSSMCSGSGTVSSPILTHRPTASLSSERASSVSPAPPCDSIDSSGLKRDTRMCSEACTLDTIVYQTPEYNYYPHRLN